MIPFGVKIGLFWDQGKLDRVRALSEQVKFVFAFLDYENILTAWQFYELMSPFPVLRVNLTFSNRKISTSWYT